MKKHELRFHAELWKQIGIQAARDGISRSEFVRRACRLLLARPDQTENTPRASVVFVE